MTTVKGLALFAAFAAAFTCGMTAQAAVVDNASNQIVASGTGAIFVRFDSVSAGDSSDIVAPGVGPDVLFNNQADPIGTIVSLGAFTAGDVIEFRLDNLARGFSVFTGLAADNFDNFVHAVLTSNPDGSIKVGFEDLKNGGDQDYNDVVFTVFEIPVPAAALLLLTGVAGLGFLRRKAA